MILKLLRRENAYYPFQNESHKLKVWRMHNLNKTFFVGRKGDLKSDILFRILPVFQSRRILSGTCSTS
jgi:hypothetical protein